MGEIEPRFYRDQMGDGRFHSFIIGYKDSDLWIGITPESFNETIPEFAKQALIDIRDQLENYLIVHPDFKTSFKPIEPLKAAPDIAHALANAAKIAGTGPMAAVAGTFSEYIGKAIQSKYVVNEVVVENGGDLYVSLQKNMAYSVYAGNSSLSGKIGVEIPASDTPLGICTSAGTVGPSVSFGKADAVVVVCKSTAVADAFATAIGNRIKSAVDIENELLICDSASAILSLLIVCEGKMGLKGKYELKLVK